MDFIKKPSKKPPTWTTSEGKSVQLIKVRAGVCWMVLVEGRRAQLGPIHRGISEAFTYAGLHGWSAGK